MNREEKQALVDELSEKFQSHNAFYITDASGMSVAKINEFRRLCFTRGLEFKVYKNTLIQKALERQKGTDYSPLFNVLSGFSGVIFSKETGNTPAKVIREFRKKLDGKPVLKAASIKSEFYIGDENLNALADMKSRDELIGEIIGMLQAPARNIISALQNRKDKDAPAAE